MTERQLVDLMRAADELEHIRVKVFDNFEPLWDEDENSFKRAMAVLHAIIKEYNRP